MLKLINGTELTEEAKEAFKKGVTNAYIKLENGTILSDSDYLKSLKIEELRYNEETENFIGEAVSKRLTLEIYNEDNSIDLENKEFEAFIGAKLPDNTIAWINYGKFIVQKPENNDTKESTEIIAFDYMSKFNQKYVPGVTFPCTFGDLAEDVCKQCGLELGNKSFRNANKLIYENFFINDEQCRVVVKEIAKIAFSWARVANDNKLYFDFKKRDINTSDELFTLDDYIELEKNEETIPINTIILRNSAVESENITIYDNALINQYGKQKELVIQEDYFAYSQQKRQELIEAARELMGLVYYPISIKSIGTIYLESNDIIGIKDKNNNTLNSYCFNHIIDYNGALYDNIESPAMTETQTKYQHEPVEDLARRRTEILVNKATQEVKILTERIENYDTRISSIEVGLDKIEAKMESSFDVTKVVDGLKKITLENCMPGNLLELHINGNNTVFESLLPRNDLFPRDDLYPYGDSLIRVVSDNILPLTSDDWENGYVSNDGNVYHDEPWNSAILITKQKIKVDTTKYFLNVLNSNYKIRTMSCYDKDGNYLGTATTGDFKENTAEVYVEIVKNEYNGSTQTYPNITPQEINDSQAYLKKVNIIDLGIEEVLRQKGDIYDTYDLVNNKAIITRRIGITEEGNLYILNEPIIEDLGELSINLTRGTNTIEILNYSAMLNAKFIIINNYTEAFASTVEFQSAIEILYNQINLQVSKKVGKDEIIARINMAVLGKEDAEIPEDIEKSIIEILANKISIKSDYTELTPEGHFTTTSAQIANWILKNGLLYSTSTTNGILYESGLDSRDNDFMLYAGLDITSGSGYLENANAYITKSGRMYAKWFDVNGESGHFNINYNSGRKALQLSKSSLDWWIDTDSDHPFATLTRIDSGGTLSGLGMAIHDAFKFGFYDSLHLLEGKYYRPILQLYRIDPNSSYWQKNTATAEFNADILVNGTREDNVNHTIWISDGSTYWEVRTAKETSSDRRLKDNIKDSTTSALDIINQIRHRSFDWKSDGKHVNIGYIAQELEKISPNFVNHNLDRDTYSINDFPILTTATKAIQELYTENKKLKEKVDKQQKMIDFLVNKLGLEEEMEDLLNGRE